jgi:hypothetical protein
MDVRDEMSSGRSLDTNEISCGQKKSGRECIAGLFPALGHALY